MEHEDIIAHVEQKHSESVNTGKGDFSGILYEILTMLKQVNAKKSEPASQPEAASPIRQKPLLGGTTG